MTTTDTRDETIAIIRSVLASPQPILALPNIAHRHGMTMTDLEQLLKHHGFPDKAKLRDAAMRIASIGYVDIEHDRPHADRAAPATEATQGSGPYVTALPVGALFADGTYQRDLDPHRVARMIKAYDAALVGIIEVSAREGGRYAILDGQHRWAMTKDVMFEAESPHIACRVHSGLTVDEEAALYHRLNTTRKQLTGWDRWKARRGAGDADVAAIEKACIGAGWTVSYRGKRGHITCTAALEKVYKVGGANLITYILSIITSAWGDDPEGPGSGTIQALGHLVGSYGEDLDRQRLIGSLSGIVPRQLNARAAAAREVHKGTIDKLTAHVIVEEYNAVERAGRLPPFLQLQKPGSPNPGTARAAEVERAKAIREWALETGLINSERSHVTKEIRDAYDAAHGGGSDA